MSNVLTSNAAADTGKLILRVTLGVLMLLHGIDKLQHGIDGIQGMVASHGLPGFFAYAVYLGEVVGPLLLIAGYYARIGAALILVNMIVAVLLVHTDHLLLITDHGGWRLELQGMFLFSALALMLMGPGRYAFNQR